MFIRKRLIFKRKRLIKFGPITLSFLTIILLTIISLFYLVQSNQISMKAFILRDLQNKKTEALAEYERLSVEAARLKSLQKINEGALNLKMVKAERIEFLPISSSVAIK